MKVVLKEKELVNLLKENIVDGLILFEFEESINNIIKENYGISEVITKFIYDNKNTLFNLVINSIGSGNIDENGVERTISSEKINFITRKYKDKRTGAEKEFNHCILFTIRSFNFKDRNQYERLSNLYRTNEGTSATDGKRFDFVNIYTHTINGKINKPEFIDTLGHELSHIFKQDMTMNTIPKNPKRYLRSFGDLYFQGELEQDIAKIIYYSEKLEQEGFANGLYYKFKEEGLKIPSWDVFEKTEQWQAYKCVCKILEKIEGKKEDVQRILNIRYNGMKFETLIKMGKYSMESFKRKLLNILYKLHMEILNEGILIRDGNICSCFIQ